MEDVVILTDERILKIVRKKIGEMIMEISLEAQGNGTSVTILFKNIPSGIRPEDNKTGTKLTLQKPANYVE